MSINTIKLIHKSLNITYNENIIERNYNKNICL